MSKNSIDLNVLNEYLFKQLERLSDDKMEDENLERELRRTDAYVSMAQTIIQSGSLQLQAMKLVGEYGDNFGNISRNNILGIENGKK